MAGLLNVDNWTSKFWTDAGQLMFDGPYPPDNAIHHYTTVEAAISIIENQTLWVSGIGFMNDFQEVHCAVNVLRNNLCVEENTFFPARRSSSESARTLARMLLDVVWQYEFTAFVCSFCEYGDLLSQWRGYGGGVSIAFDPSNLAGCFHRNIDDKHSYIWLNKVVYGASAQANILDALIFRADEYLTSQSAHINLEFIKRDTIDTLKVYFQNIAAKMKNAAFAEEREWRLTVTRSRDRLEQDPAVKFRTRGRGIVPYIDLHATERPLPIKGITVAPSAHPSVGPAIQALLAKKGYMNVPVHASIIPFRD